MDLTVPEPGAAPRLHMAFCDSGHRATNDRCRLLSHYGLLVDCRNNRLLDVVTSLSTEGLIAPQAISSVKVVAGGTPPDELLEEFPGLTTLTGSHREVRHNTTHLIRTTPGPPAACRPRRLAPDCLAVAKA
jgi:hypothetical protein